MIPEDAELLLNKVLSEFNRYLMISKSSEEKFICNEAKLYIFKHIDLTKNKDRSILPTFLKPVVYKYFDNETIEKSFEFLDDEEWLLRIEEKNRALNFDY